MVIEVHWFANHDTLARSGGKEFAYKALTDLQKHFYLYHVHFNNHVDWEPNTWPDTYVFETSWIRKDLVK